MIAKNTIGLCVFSFQTRLKNMYFFEHSNLNNNFENGSSKKHRLHIMLVKSYFDTICGILQQWKVEVGLLAKISWEI